MQNWNIKKLEYQKIGTSKHKYQSSIIWQTGGWDLKFAFDFEKFLDNIGILILGRELKFYIKNYTKIEKFCIYKS